jgi:hypothetical protein
MRLSLSHPQIPTISLYTVCLRFAILLMHLRDYFGDERLKFMEVKLLKLPIRVPLAKISRSYRAAGVKVMTCGGKCPGRSVQVDIDHTLARRAHPGRQRGAGRLPPKHDRLANGAESGSQSQPSPPFWERRASPKEEGDRQDRRSDADRPASGRSGFLFEAGSLVSGLHRLERSTCQRGTSPDRPSNRRRSIQRSALAQRTSLSRTVSPGPNCIPDKAGNEGGERGRG